MPYPVGILFRQMLFQVLLIVAPILAVGFMIAFITDVAQVKWKPTLDPIKPKLSKLNPLKGTAEIHR